ncbi:uncharacterized protein B0H18DRAFT_1001552 [Fomitopsis serialis]|uniref:uncharacterized protein n=1 Tax=Fomitopsis serialis TaxID=139415 RepID=UPI002008341A|nr:uncharacterized protein B0H18DRAFT_1001552 [Neoantrodia serialis]KAH9928164.1 hypothetical protein B0H18DRAFT_1001552 [Neoantrodia serialis]
MHHHEHLGCDALLHSQRRRGIHDVRERRLGQGLFNVSVASDDPGATDSVTDNSIQYSPRALWSQLDLPKYLATGLNQSATYQVKIANQGANLTSHLCASTSPLSTNSATPSLSQTLNGASTTPFGPSSPSISQSNKLSTAAIGAGIAVGCAVLLILFVALWITRRLQRRTLNMPARLEPFFQAPPMIERSSTRAQPEVQHGRPVTKIAKMTDTTTLPSAAASKPPHRDSDLYETIGSRIHERDAGPAIEPPVYDPAWAVHMLHPDSIAS